MTLVQHISLIILPRLFDRLHHCGLIPIYLKKRVEIKEKKDINKEEKKLGRQEKKLNSNIYIYVCIHISTQIPFCVLSYTDCSRNSLIVANSNAVVMTLCCVSQNLNKRSKMMCNCLLMSLVLSSNSAADKISFW